MNIYDKKNITEFGMPTSFIILADGSEGAKRASVYNISLCHLQNRFTIDNITANSFADNTRS